MKVFARSKPDGPSVACPWCGRDLACHPESRAARIEAHAATCPSRWDDLDPANPWQEVA